MLLEVQDQRVSKVIKMKITLLQEVNACTWIIASSPLVLLIVNMVNTYLKVIIMMCIQKYPLLTAIIMVA